MSSPFVLSVSGIQDYDESKPPTFPNLDFWVLHILVDGVDKYVKLLPHQYRPAEKIINCCPQIDLLVAYMGFDEPAQDGRFQLNEKLISYYDLEVIAKNLLLY